ncbi:MAG: DUF72 domain-containing protein [Vulcanimicrobiaceae bacterium]
MEVSLGTQGWSYADWAGDMYDAAARPDTYLRAYAQEFASVEIDATFYGTPPPERIARWVASVPDGFVFSLKVPREITHERRMVDVRGLVREFYDAVRLFGRKLGCVLVQFDASFSRADEANLRSALDAFPSDVRTAFEFRDPAWYVPEIQRTLEARGWALAVADAPFVPRAALAPVLERTTLDFAYVRLIGDHAAFDRFDAVRLDRRAELAWWATAIGAAAPRVRRVYGYVNNHYQGHSPATVRALYAALAIPHVRPARVRQTSLFS